MASPTKFRAAVAALGVAALTATGWSALAPYGTDSNTVALFHLDEAAGSGVATNTGSLGRNAYPVDLASAVATPAVATNVLGQAAFPGFGSAAGFSGGLVLGYDSNGSGAYQADVSSSSLSADRITLSNLNLGNGGQTPFTIEALVCPDSIAANQEIVSTDSSATTRGFQFRINSSGQLEFNAIGWGAQVTNAIPASGPHAFVAGSWYHAAVTYDGTNLTLYWTALGSGVSQANALGTKAAAIGAATTRGPLCIGNENRGAAGEPFLGRIDEVRISKVARTATDFVFQSSPDSDADGLDDAWEIASFGDLSQGPNDDFDKDGFTNLAEYAVGSDPANPAQTPSDLDADGLADSWEVTYFGSAAAQSGAGDPDGDFATNAQEQAAGSNPLSASSFPDADGDGLNDGWEIHWFGGLATGNVDSDGDGASNLEEMRAGSSPTDAAWSPAAPKLAHRWSFSGDLLDSVGASNAQVVDGGTNNATLGATSVTLSGGASTNSDYVSLGSNLLAGKTTPVTVEIWATQNSVKNWGRIFDFGSGTAESLMMSWCQGTTLASDRVEHVDGGVTTTANNTCAPYALGTLYHIVMVLTPAAYTAGDVDALGQPNALAQGTRVAWYVKAAGAAALGPCKGTFDTSQALASLADVNDWLGRSQWAADSIANATYDEVRLWHGALGAAAREALHASGPDNASLADTDNDGLYDTWENIFLHGLGQTGAADPDGDGYSNAAEQAAGSDPLSASSLPNDSDQDGLPDSWETALFGSLSQTGSGDPDGDGFTNAEEYAGSSNPTLQWSVPGDSDADGLSDAWEQTNFGSLSSGAYDDPDGDGYTNVSEMSAGTSPNNFASRPVWVGPRVSLVQDSVVTTNALLFASGATYGRAINGLSFQDRILLTHDGYQYTAWYDKTSMTVYVARRTISGGARGAWEVVNTGSTFVNGSGGDAHNVIALGICATDGTLHMAWDMHGHTLRYRKSVAGLCTTNKTAWGASMFNAEQSWLVASGQTVSSVTYPIFVSAPGGGLVFQWRYGASGAGDNMISAYNPGTGAWSTPIMFDTRAGTYVEGTFTGTSRNAYLNGVDFAPDGTIHITWTYREGAGTANHDLCHAYSPDLGVTWKNGAGQTIANTSLGEKISLTSPGIQMKRMDMKQLFINQQAQCVDKDGRLHMLGLHRREDPGYAYPNITTAVYSINGTAYYHYFRDPATGRWAQRRIPPDIAPVGCRPKIAYDALGNLYAVWLTYTNRSEVFPGYREGYLAVATASKASSYSDWEVVYKSDTVFNGEPIVDQTRLEQDGVLSVFIQEDSATTSAVGTPLHVIEFATSADTDSDGLPDAWETASFGGIAAQSASGDADADGMSNAQEYKAGTDPNDPKSVLKVEGVSVSGGDMLVSFASVAGKIYKLEYSEDLVSWSAAGQPFAGTGGQITVLDSGAASRPKRFYRIALLE